MAQSYSIEVNKEQVQDAISLFKFVGGNSADAVRIAINKSMTPVRQKVSDAIRSQVRLKAGYVKDRKNLRVVKASRQKLNGKISANSRGLLMTRYSTDAKIANYDGPWQGPAPPVPARGIRVKIKPSGSTKNLSSDKTKPAPFYMVFKNKALGIVRRRGADEIGPRGGTIKVYNAPSLSQVFNTVRDDVLPEAANIYQKQLLDAMRYLLQKQYPPET